MPISFTELGIINDPLNLEQSAKIEKSIYVNEFESFNSPLNPEHPLNA